MRDVHALEPDRTNLALHQVGLTSVKRPLTVDRREGHQTLSATFDVSIDLPAERKGSDLSRTAEALAEVVDRAALAPVPSLESACASIAVDLLTRHPYARSSRVQAFSDYYLRRGLEPGRTSLEEFRLLAGARAHRQDGGAPSVVRSIGAEAVGMTACPCAMETCRAALEAEFPLLKDPSLATLPIVTHNQRCRTRLVLELSGDAEVEADEIIALLEEAQSAPTYSILKRGDEARLVLQAHRNPKFVEDVLRDLLYQLPKRFPRLPDETTADASTTSEESIHKYDVVAQHRATLGELRSTAGR